MTRERAKELLPVIQAFAEGKEIQSKLTGDSYCIWARADEPQWSAAHDYRIKPEPKMRPMTRGEILYMITTTQALVIRAVNGEKMYPSCEISSWDHPERADYAIVDKTGEPIDGWHKFEKEIE